MMRRLAEAGADPRATTDDGTTALMLGGRGLGKRAATDVTYYDWTEEEGDRGPRGGPGPGAWTSTRPTRTARPPCTPAARTTTRTGSSGSSSTGAPDINALNAAGQTPLRIAEGHLICCTTFVRHGEAAARLRGLGADPDAGIPLTFGLTNYGDEAAAEPRP